MGIEFIEKELTIKNFKTVDLLSGFISESGENLPMEFTSWDYDLRNYLLEGIAKALTKTESIVYHDCQIGKHTSCWYNSISKHLVGNYENWLFAESVKGWCIGPYKKRSWQFKNDR